MNFRWLQFWGDLRQGMHEGWQDEMAASLPGVRAMLTHHHRASALALRDRFGVAASWDRNFTPDDAPWLMLEPHDFNRWCEAVGLLTLGEHLKRILSVRAIERLKVTLDRRTLSMLLTHIQSTPEKVSALPLDLPTARELGARALCAVVSRNLPQVWSRFRLRLDPMLVAQPDAVAARLVQLPDMAGLKILDATLFNQNNTARRKTSPELEEEETWMQARTLSA